MHITVHYSTGHCSTVYSCSGTATSCLNAGPPLAELLCVHLSSLEHAYASSTSYHPFNFPPYCSSSLVHPCSRIQ